MNDNKYFVKHLVLVVGVLALLGSAQQLLAVESQTLKQTNQARPRPVTSPVSPPLTQEEVVAFSQQSAQVGDRVAQTVSADLLVNSTITQTGQIANESQSKIKRRQQRFLEVLEVAEGRVRRVHVTYPLSRLTSPEGESAEQEVVQPVEKKSYLVTRQGKRLLVTDAEGGLPSQDEFEIVATGLQNLGLPNPLIKFLLGRTIRVGDRLQLPLEIAERLMGFGDQLGKVKQFELLLKSVRMLDGQRCAVFAATIAATGAPDKPMNIHMFGQIIIQTETCRMVRAELSGPLTISSVEHTPAGSFQFSARGTLRLAVQSKYGHARQ